MPDDDPEGRRIGHSVYSTMPQFLQDLQPYFRKLAAQPVWREQEQKAEITVPSSIASLPWYESTLLWGAGGISMAIVLTVVAAMKHDLRWLLIVALPFWCVAMWAATAPLKRRRMMTVGLSLVGAASLFVLNSWLEPQAEPPLTSVRDVELPHQVPTAHASNQ